MGGGGAFKDIQKGRESVMGREEKGDSEREEGFECG